MKTITENAVCAAILFWAIFTAVPSVAARASPDVSRHIRLTLTVENPSADTLADQRIWIYAPVGETGTQVLESLRVSIPHKVSSDALGNTIIELMVDRMPPYGTRIVTISADLQLRPEPRRQPLLDKTYFLVSEPFVPMDDPEINSLAARLKRTSEIETVRAIYDWVRERLTYAGYLADDMGASYALRNLRGDCTEYAYLVAALARANSIPARVMGGYFTDRDLVPRARDYHNWAEVYLDGAWHVVDAQKQNAFEKAEQYVAFRIVTSKVANAVGDKHRFRAAGAIVVRME